MAVYLSDKGHLSFAPAEQNYRETLLFLLELEQVNKLTPVFDYNGYVIVIDRNIYDYQIEECKDRVRASYDMIKQWKDNKAVTYKPFKGQFDPFQDAFVNQRYRKYVDDGKTIILYANNYDDDIAEVELLYPKEQIDLALNQPTNLKDELDQAHARIAELENQSGNKELPTRSQNTVGTIIAGLANLAKIDLTSHYGDDSNKKIRQELLKLGFKANEKDGLPLSSETVAKWLKIADDLSK